MRRLLYAISLIVLLSAFIYRCNNSEEKLGDKDSTKTALIQSFGVGDYNFAVLENDEFMQYNKAIYHRGDEVFMVFENVGPFAVGSDSLIKADMRLEVVNAIGEKVVVREHFLGDKGHAYFKDNIIPKPYASFVSSQDEKPGKYTMTVTIYDLVVNDSIVVYDDFYLE